MTNEDYVEPDFESIKDWQLASSTVDSGSEISSLEGEGTGADFMETDEDYK
jgi:hypothetical protein